MTWPQYMAFCVETSDEVEVQADVREDVPEACPTCGGVLVVYKLVDRPSTYDGVVE